ncbi:MAG: inorganic pyrophosphatase [Oscillospiraceae bacterium]|nr:inorganic pyrophosphatase [Oscillospiraceae bacterium]
MDFWQALDLLVEEHELVIDRPAGSAHPRYPSFVYPLDYGYLKGTSSSDGGGIDVWRGSDPGAGINAIKVTVDMMKRDSEIKILLGCTQEEMEIISEAHNSQFMKSILIKREGVPHAP